MRFLKKVFSLERVVGLAMLGALAWVQTTDPDLVRFARLKTFDFYQTLHPRTPIPKEQRPVTVIDLDEASLAEVGQWPWPRTTIAQMISNLMQMGVGLVAFDVVFAEPDRMNPSSIAESMYNLPEEMRNELKKLPSNDEVLAQVVKQSRVVLGQAGYWEEIEIEQAPPIRKNVAFLTKGEVQAENFLPKFPWLIRNVWTFEQHALGHGIFSVVPEDDGVVRRVATVFYHDGRVYPALSVEILRLVFGRKGIVVRADQLGVTEVRVAKDKIIPTDRAGRAWPYYSKFTFDKYVSARDVLSGTVDPSAIQGKIVIIGTSAVGLRDIRSIPTAADVPGVEVHAQMIETVLTDQYLKRPSYLNGAELLLVVGAGLLMIWLVPAVGAKWTMLLFFTMSAGAVGTSWHLFVNERVLFDAAYPVAATLLLYTTLTYLGYAREEKQRQQVRSAFGFYLSPDMVERLAENPDQLALGGESREMTLLFCDVRGFTTISEQFTAEGLTKLINKLLTPLTNVIMSNRGTVDKYMGDCIMAFWNAPLDDADHQRHACISALGMVDEMQPLNDRLEKEAEEEGRKHIPLKVGIGLNSGEAVVGNMGSDQRFDYSVLGDTVNLASRLEGQSKAYGVTIVIGDTTNAAVPDFATLELDLIKVKGKTEAVRIFTLLGNEEVAQSAEFKNLKELHEAMLKAYRAQNWAKCKAWAAEAKKLAERFNITGLYELYSERADEYAANPPGSDWDGVFVATSK